MSSPRGSSLCSTRSARARRPKFSASQSLGHPGSTTQHCVVVETDTPQWRGWLERVGDDWWATLLAGVIVALAVADVLPKIPW